MTRFEDLPEPATLTARYAATHYALASIAAEYRTQPFALRVVLALADDPENRIDVHRLAEVLCCEGSAIRRACQDLYAFGWVHGEGADGGYRRPGIVTVLRLTDEGRRVADRLVFFRAKHVELREAARG